MPFALIIAGIVLTVAGVRSTEGALFSYLKNDFTGQPSFVWWALSILAIGSVGYLPGMRQLANAFLALILIVLILANNKGKNVFADFFAAFKNIPAAPVGGKAVASNDNSGGSGSILSQPFSLGNVGKLFTYDFGPSVDNALSNIPVIGPLNKAIGAM